MLITLTEWDKKNYSHPHHIATLRKWAKQGLFQPGAVRHGYKWWVDEDAVYVPPDRSTAHRLRQAKVMQNNEQLNDVDPRVLEILNNGSRAA